MRAAREAEARAREADRVLVVRKVEGETVLLQLGLHSVETVMTLPTSVLPPGARDGSKLSLVLVDGAAEDAAKQSETIRELEALHDKGAKLYAAHHSSAAEGEGQARIDALLDKGKALFQKHAQGRLGVDF